MKVMVTGATGFVGREIVRQLGLAGHEARGFGSRNRFEFGGADAVIHLVGIIQERGANTFEHAHVALTAEALQAATAAGASRFLHMSALGTRPNAHSRYHQTKWVAEELVRASGLAWTIFRPSLIYGAHDQSVRKLARIARLAPVVPVLGDGLAKIQPISVEQVACSFVVALQNATAVGKTYDLCGPAAFTWVDLHRQLLAAQGKRKPLVHLPLPLLRAMAGILETVLPAPPFTRDQLIMLQEDNVGDPQPAVRDLGLALEPFAPALGAPK
jgi:NADH dehydrogenase